MKRILASFGFAAILAGPAYADGTINTLTAGSALTGTEQIPMFQGSNPAVTTTPNAIKTFTNALVNHPGYLPSVWYTPLNQMGFGATSGGPVAATAYCTIIQIGGNSLVTVSSLAFRIATAGSSNAQLALYNDNASGTIHRPGTLIDSTPNIVDTGTGPVSGNLNATHQISPGFYWACLQVNDTTVRIFSVNSGGGNGPPYVNMVGSATLANVLNTGGNTMVGVSTFTGITAFGTWPSFVGATFAETNNIAPLIAFEFSSVP